MPSIRGSLEHLQPVVEVSIAGHARPTERVTCRGLIDTGATRTCLTAGLIGKLHLPFRTKMLVASAQSGPERRRAYGFSLGLFCQVDDQLGSANTLHVFAQELVAPDFMDNGNFDVLLGMDLLSTGRLIFEHGGFSFDF